MSSYICLVILVLLPSCGFSNLPAILYYSRPVYKTTRSSKPGLNSGNDAQLVLNSFVKTQIPALCDECDKTRPSPCGDRGLQCLQGMCVNRAKDLKKCRGELPPGGLCEICITQLRDCALGLECYMNHCIAKNDDGSGLCSNNSKECQLKVLHKCTGSGPCQRCGGGMPACGHQLRCVDGRCAASFSDREKCGRKLKKVMERKKKAIAERNFVFGNKSIEKRVRKSTK